MSTEGNSDHIWLPCVSRKMAEEEEIMLIVALSYILKHVWEMPVCTILLKDPRKDPMSMNVKAAPDIAVQRSIFPRNQAKTFIVTSLTETGQHSSLLSSLSPLGQEDTLRIRGKEMLLHLLFGRSLKHMKHQR